MPIAEILVNGKRFQVRQNLYDFLKIASESGDSWTTWVDQICIDQNTVSERNHQVSLMAKIYNKASEIIVWLGLGDQSTQKALVRIQQDYESYKKRPPSPPGQYIPSHKWITCDQDEGKNAVKAIFNNTYFTRLWIVQELLLSQKKTVYCGPAKATWESFRFVFHNSFNVLKDRMTQLVFYQAEKMSFFENIEAICKFKCQDPRDKVYGALSFLKPRGRIVVDYSKSVEEVFLDAVRAITREAFRQYDRENGWSWNMALEPCKHLCGEMLGPHMVQDFERRGKSFFFVNNAQKEEFVNCNYGKDAAQIMVKQWEKFLDAQRT
jgi:hypothetical protein